MQFATIARDRRLPRPHHLLAISFLLWFAVVVKCFAEATPTVISNKVLDLAIPAAYVDSTHRRLPDRDYEIVYAVLPDMRPSSPSGWNDPLRVRIEMSRLRGPSRTERFLAEYERLKNTTALARPVLVSSSNQERKFTVRTSQRTSNVATYIVRTSEGNSPWTVEDPGPWARTFTVYRTVGHLAVRYQFRKEGTPNVDVVDSGVISLVKRFQSTQ